MEGTYDVTLNGQTVGTVELRREGLYYRLSCRCRLPGQEIHRLYADGEKLGVLLPARDGWQMETKVAAKRIRENCRFTLDGNRTYIPIRLGEPFEHLDKVRSGRLGVRGGEPGLLMDE